MDSPRLSVRPMTKRSWQKSRRPNTVRGREFELQSSLIKAINEASPEGILVVDDEGVVVNHNRRFIEIWQIPADRLKGDEPGTAVGASDNPVLKSVLTRVKEPEAFLARIRELYDNPALTDHCEIELIDGRTVERHSTALVADDGRYLGRAWFFHDITPHKQAEAALVELSLHDALTGVANRRSFFERAGHEFARTKRHDAPLSIAELDIDFFKLVNDRYGHAVGDEVLKSIGTTCQRLLREVDLFARIGGEEFAVLLPDTNLEGARFQGERLRQAIANNRVSIDHTSVSCTISIGVATLKPSDSCIEDCLLRADIAMYRAKEKGRNRVEVAT